ncbi:hypothetical protein Dimus_019930, partial [Dionaea muscipula]
ELLFVDSSLSSSNGNSDSPSLSCSSSNGNSDSPSLSCSTHRHLAPDLNTGLIFISIKTDERQLRSPSPSPIVK